MSGSRSASIPRFQFCNKPDGRGVDEYVRRYTPPPEENVIRPLATLALVLALPLIASDQASPQGLTGGLRRGGQFGAAVVVRDGKPTIDMVGPGTPAATAGFQAGDVLVSIDGTPLATPAEFVSHIGRKRGGEAVTIVARRGSETLTKTVTLIAKPLEQRDDYTIEYGSVEVDGAKRRVIVTRPRAAGRHPAVLLIGGIGCYSLDGILRPAEPQDAYGRLLDAWTRAGFVTMRVEKSGMGDSEGPPCSDPRSDFEAEVRGYAAGLRQLQSRDFVDTGNVFAFAHSIGPLVAAKIASDTPLRGLVVADTIGTSWLEYDLTNVRRQLVLSGMPYDEVDRRVREHAMCAHRFYAQKQTPAQVMAADAGCADDLQFPAPYTYMHQIGALDLAPLWKKIDAPVLILYGTADFVTDDYQHRYLRDMINAFHPGRATYSVIEGMDHGFFLPGSQKAAFEGTPGAPFAQQVVDQTLDFFGRHRTAGAAPAANTRR